MNDTKDQKKKTILIVVAAIVLVAAATAGILFFSGVFNPKPAETHGVVGMITDDWDTDIEDKGAEEKQGTQIPGYSSAEMNAGDTTLKINIGNPKGNKVGMLAVLKLSDGTVLYESPLLQPGQGVTEVPLNKTLEKGTYDAMVEYRCVLLDGKNTPLNAAQSGFKLIVK